MKEWGHLPYIVLNILCCLATYVIASVFLILCIQLGWMHPIAYHSIDRILIGFSIIWERSQARCIGSR